MAPAPEPLDPGLYDYMRRQMIEHPVDASYPGFYRKGAVLKLLMEFFASGTVATLACSSVGDASVYLSTGQVVIGGVARAPVRGKAKAFVRMAEGFLPGMSPSREFPRVHEGMVQFFAFTASEVWQTEQRAQAALKPLEDAGHRVVVEMGRYTR